MNRSYWKRPVSICILLMSIFLMPSCGENGTSNTEDTDEIKLDPEIAKKIIQDDAGVTAGDGMYSIALPDGRSIFLMGDSYTGKV